MFGYTIVNDVTARDRQVRRTPEGMTWYELGSGKAFDSGAPLGPCIVTADEIADPQNLKVMSRINGELRQSSNTSNMIWTCAELIHFFSRNFTLKPGMVIITGTPAGTAWSADKELGGKGVTQPGLVPATRYCLPGDIVECEVEKIGTSAQSGRAGRCRGVKHRRRIILLEQSARGGQTARSEETLNFTRESCNASPQIPAGRACSADRRLVRLAAGGASLAVAQHHHDRARSRRAGRPTSRRGRWRRRWRKSSASRWWSTTAPARAAWSAMRSRRAPSRTAIRC